MLVKPIRLVLLPLALCCGACNIPFIRDEAPEPLPVALPEAESTVSAEDTPIAASKPEPGPALPHTDVWERIRDELRLERPLKPAVRQELKRLGRKDRFVERAAQRAEPYLFYIVEEIHARQMPIELALLPMVESGYRYGARSPSGASGLWQFMPMTAKTFGLRRDWWFDERRDLRGSTQAALKYLRLLHERFDDWLLAIAAYNCGEGTLAKAIRANRSRGKPVDFWSLQLPPETRRYVPRLLAIAELLARPAQYNVQFEPVPNQAYFDVVDIGSQIEMSRAGELANLEAGELQALNAGHLRWASAPEGPHELLLPINRVTSFRTALAALPPDQRVVFGRHVVAKGETLSHIADRYGAGVHELKRTNNLRGHLIHPGQTLMIPNANSAAIAARSAQRQEAVSTRVRSQAPVHAQHRVRSGDSLWKLGRRYQVSVAQLARWNNIAVNATLRPGQLLTVSLNAPVADTGASSIAYVVRNGDSLWRIARRHGLRVRDITSLNALSKSATLRPGQTLKLPANADARGI